MHGHHVLALEARRDRSGPRPIPLARSGSAPRTLGRRELLRRLGLATAGLAVGACTPLRIGLHAWPERFDAEPGLTDRVLRAFVATIVPGVDPGAGDPARPLRDPYYHFSRYRAFLASDLCRRAARRFGEGAFERLPLRRREEVVSDGLHADGTTRRLYVGAVFLVQVATYAGIYDDAHGCPLIDFEGRFRPRPLSEFTYPSPGRFLASGLTDDGNIA